MASASEKIKAQSTAHRKLHLVCMAHLSQINTEDPGVSDRIHDGSASADDYLRALDVLNRQAPGAAAPFVNGAPAAKEPAPPIEPPAGEKVKNKGGRPKGSTTKPAADDKQPSLPSVDADAKTDAPPADATEAPKPAADA